MKETLQKNERKHNRRIECLGQDELERIKAEHKAVGSVIYFPTGIKSVDMGDGRRTVVNKDAAEEIASKKEMVEACAAKAKIVVAEFIYGAYCRMGATDLEYLGAICEYLNDDTELYYVERSIWHCPDFILELCINFYS